MQLVHEARGDALVVRFVDRTFDAHAAASFRDQIDEVIGEGHHHIVLDLSIVEFLDSTGLGAVVSTLKRLNGRGMLVLCGLRDSVRNVFRLTRMDRVFTILETDEQAVEHIERLQTEPGRV